MEQESMKFRSIHMKFRSIHMKHLPTLKPLFWIFFINGVTQYIVFVSGFFHLASSFPNLHHSKSYILFYGWLIFCKRHTPHSVISFHQLIATGLAPLVDYYE